MNDNLSFLIDYLYQKYIENHEEYTDCIYDNEQLKRRSYLLEDDFISRFKLDNRYSYKYRPYSLSKNVIKKLSSIIEVSKLDFIEGDYISNLYDIKITDSRILYYNQNKLLLNNSFDDDIIIKRNNELGITTFDLINKIRNYTNDKRN